MTEFFEDVLLEGLIDTLKILPFLFLTYMLMEFIEHRAAAHTRSLVRKAGAWGPLLGGMIGVVPQCGFSAAAAGLYAGRILSMGTLVAVFLSTSDEMLPLMISAGAPVQRILALVGIKAVVGIVVGFAVDMVLRLFHTKDEDICIHDLCEHEGCGCDRGIVRSALHHTLHISLFLFLVAVGISTVVFFVGEDILKDILYDRPVLSHLIAVLVGFVPNCAASVALTELYLGGFLTAGTLLAGLLPGAGVGVLVLFRTNRRMGENLTVAAVLAAVGLTVGLLVDVTGLSETLLSIGM